MQKVDYFVLTQILYDDIYFPDGRSQLNVLGGGAYTVAGMRIWSDYIGICSGVGTDFEGKLDGWFIDNGVHVAMAKRDMPCTHTRINYFEGDEREEILMEGVGSHSLMQPRISEIPALYDQCRGMYLFKDCEEVFWIEAVKYLKSLSMISVWEILGASAKWENRETISDYLQYIDMFSLNLTEGKQLTKKDKPIDIMKNILSLGAKTAILRLGPNGALVSEGKSIYHVPAVPVNVVDVTGAGNSSTGGFLTGYCENGGDILKAGVCASVSASFVLQQFGLPALIDRDMRKNAHVLAHELLRNGIEKI